MERQITRSFGRGNRQNVLQKAIEFTGGQSNNVVRKC